MANEKGQTVIYNLLHRKL